MKFPNQNTAFNRALMWAVRPFVRLAVAHGMTYPAWAEMLKTVYVDVARRDFALAETASSDSRINVLTGIHRKEIRRLRELEAEGMESPLPSVALGAQLAGVWVGRAPYIDEHGKPKPLARLASVGKELSFEALVGSISKDIRSRAVLDEWLRLGVASINKQDEVVLNAAAFIPNEGYEEKLVYFGHNLHDHAQAAVHNLLGVAPPKMERSVHYNALSADSVAALEAIARRMGMEMLQALNRQAIEFEARDAKDLHNLQRFTCGVYFHSETASPIQDTTP